MTSRAILFDLDGTLVDSLADIQAALVRMLARLGLPPIDRATAMGMVGDGVKVSVTRALAHHGRDFDSEALASFVADYTANSATLTRPFDGIPAVLDQLAGEGWQLAVCTNKPDEAARKLLTELGLIGWFAVVAGGDRFPVRKPDPGHLTATLDLLGVAPSRAVMVGDHANDVISARAAGMPCVFAGWGYGTPAMADGATVAATPAELPGRLAALLPR